jgi:hypothetical protein
MLNKTLPYSNRCAGLRIRYLYVKEGCSATSEPESRIDLDSSFAPCSPVTYPVLAVP